MNVMFFLTGLQKHFMAGMVNDYPFLKKFDGLLISGEDKLIKPDLPFMNLAIETI